jgi:hypothetical protein
MSWTMKTKLLSAALLSVATVCPASGAAGDRGAREAQTPDPATRRAEITVTGRATEIHGRRLFTIREESGRELLVLTPRPLSPAVGDATIRIEGVLRRLDDAELRRMTDIDAADRERLSGSPVLVARSVLAALRGRAASPSTAAVSPAGAERDALLPPGEPPRLTMGATMLASHIDGFAGKPVKILDALIVGVLAPNAFLIEPATRYLKPLGERDRVLVLVQSGALTEAPELLVGYTVTVTGVARTLLGMQVTREVAWPERITREYIDRLDVRGVLLAASVQTPDGDELTQ